MSFRDEAVAANEVYARSFTRAERSAPPTRRVAVLACMDARLRPEDVLGLGLGEAHVIRNAGGRVTDDAVRSLMLSSAVLGTREAVVIHHTDCGLLGTTNEELGARVTEVTGLDVSGTDFRAFDDADRTLRDDVGVIQSDRRLVFTQVSGFIYDVHSGRLREVPTS